MFLRHRIRTTLVGYRYRASKREADQRSWEVKGREDALQTAERKLKACPKCFYILRLEEKEACSYTSTQTRNPSS